MLWNISPPWSRSDHFNTEGVEWMRSGLPYPKKLDLGPVRSEGINISPADQQAMGVNPCHRQP